MSSHLKAALAAAALALCTVASQAAPNTVGLEFEGVAGTNFDGGQSFVENGFRFTAIDPFGSGFVGAGSGGGTCSTNICPSHDSAFYAVLNDGAVRMERSGGGGFSLLGFDLGFITNAYDPLLVGTIGKILVQGVGAFGTQNAEFALEGLDGLTGVGAFAHFSFDDLFSSASFTQVTFTSCVDDGAGSCIAGASFNLGQFGLDGVQVIPEPASLALVSLGLFGAAAARRRRNA